MKIILKENIENLGLTGDVVTVKPGYGRNYLIPRGMAVVANNGNVARFEEEKRQRAHKVEQERRDAEAIVKRLEGMEIVVSMPVGEDNRLFGTVTTQQIADELKAKGMDVDRRKITLSEEIRVTGVYPATVRVHPDHDAELKVSVVPQEQQV